MAIQPMALAVNTTGGGNALGAFAEGQQHAQQSQMNQMAMAQQALKNIGSLAFGVMGGSLDGKADPQLWEEALDMLGQQGIPVDSFRGRPDMAPIIAKASVDTLGQMNHNLNEQQLEQRMMEFQHQVSEALKGTTDQQNFAAAQADPTGFGQFLADKTAPNPPANVGEYNFYADQERAAGREPLSYADFQLSQKGNGLTVTTGPDGTTTVQQGGNARPLTEGQSKDTVYATRASAALPAVEKYEQNLLSLGESVVGNVPVLGNFMQSEEYQLGRDAGLDFLASILRKDTGAAVTPSEEALYGRIFLPQPGDKPAVVDAKRDRRALAVEAIKAGMPAQALENMAKALEAQGGTPPQAEDSAKSALPDGVTEEDVQHTMQIHGMTRDQVLEAISAAP